MYKNSFDSLFFSLVSPVRDDSSTVTLPLITTPSAGTLSPEVKKITSPTTISSIFNSIFLEFLFTLHFILEASSWSLWNAFSLPYSEIVEIKDAKKIANTIPMVSYILDSLNKNKTLIASAINNIFIIGSFNDSIKRVKKEFFFLFVNKLLPYFFLDSITSLSFKPFWLLIVYHP